MEIGIVGLNGRMSQAVIEAIEQDKNFGLSGVLVRNNYTHPNFVLYQDVEELAKNCQAIIDFSNPTTSIKIAENLANKNVIHICGTTGFSEKEYALLKDAARYVTMVYSPNMSIGINLLQILVKTAASKLNNAFDVAISDIHHKHKKDSPSGTALMLAKTIEQETGMQPQISALRIGEFPGEHNVIFSAAGESITLSHQAFDRSIFAQGALKACLWAKGKNPGFYSMQDVLNGN